MARCGVPEAARFLTRLPFALRCAGICCPNRSGADRSGVSTDTANQPELQGVEEEQATRRFATFFLFLSPGQLEGSKAHLCGAVLLLSM